MFLFGFLTKERLGVYARLTRFDKPIGSLLLLWPTLWGLWFAAEGFPNVLILLVFVMGTVLMRSAGCVINDFADRHFDAHVERTQNRPFAQGEVTEKEALLLALFLSLIAFLLLLPLNRLTILMSLPAVFLAATYPFTKRFFPIPQAYLGIAFGFGIPMAFAAVQNEVPMVAWTLLLANVFWTLAYDTEYAMCDKEDDIKIGIHTSALTFGRFDVLAVVASHVIFLVLMAAIGAMMGRGVWFLCGLVAAGMFMLVQFRMIRTRDRQACFHAFLANNHVGLVIWLALIADYYFN